MKRFTQPMLALLMMLGCLNMSAMETSDFQELCMALGKGGPWAVNDGGDAGFTVGDAAMHYLGDYTEQGFSWNQRFAYEYADGRGKFTMRNKNNSKDKNCGMFSWDYAHYFSILGLQNGDKVTITIPTGTVTFASSNAEGIGEGDAVVSNQCYTITTTDASTRLDIQMAAASLIAKIVIEPYGEESIPEITVTPQALKLVPGATSKLSATVAPSAAATQWKSDNEAVATVAADGTVTAIAAGTANIVNYWASEVSDATASASCTVTVADVDLGSLAVATSYDFTAMGDVELTIQDEAAGAIWNAANNKNNNVFFCTNEGLESIAVQAVLSGNKGWSIVDGKGLYEGSGAGRCAAIGGIKAGQVVEFIYTGEVFYTSASDDGIEKEALNEGMGRAIYKAGEDGMIGFELVKGNYVEKIIVYAASDAPATFDFNAMDVAVSSSSSQDGDINEPLVLTEQGVTLTVSPAEEGSKTPNRFWGTNNGPQLRCYSGTITIESATAFKTIEFDANSNFNLSADNGTLTGKTWTGDATKVIFTVIKNTQLNKITVSAEAGEEPVVPELPTAANIAAFKALEKGTEAKLTLNEAYVTAVTGNNAYVQDATGGLYFYSTGLTLTAGKKLNGSIVGKLDIYNSLPEFTKTSDTNADAIAESDGTATPKDVSVAESLTAENVSMLVKISGTDVALEGNNYFAVDGDSKIQIYDSFKVLPADFAYPAKADITGIIGMYKGTPQLYPLDANSITSAQDSTGIKGVRADVSSQTYNLQGQRVTNAQKGIYIQNGKKVLVK